MLKPCIKAFIFISVAEAWEKNDFSNEVFRWGIFFLQRSSINPTSAAYSLNNKP